MKLLGRFNRSVALHYQDLLAESDVITMIDDWSNSYEKFAGIAMVNLMVEEEGYEKSRALISDFEDKAAQKVAGIDTSEINILMAVIVGTIAIFLFIGYCMQ